MTSHNPNLKQEEDAQVGIGTMIVFIATVLVAAVAAGVLINVSGDLQSQATATGDAATENVASNLVVQSVYGDRTCTAGPPLDCSGHNIQFVDIYVALGAGSSPVDLSAMVIQVGDTNSVDTYTHATATTTTFSSSAERGSSDTLLSAGDLNKLRFEISPEWAENTEVSIQLLPEVGNPITVTFTTPTAYGDKQMQELF